MFKEKLEVAVMIFTLVSVCVLIWCGLFKLLLSPEWFLIVGRVIIGMGIFTCIALVSKAFNDMSDNPKLYYDKQRKCYVVKYNGETEYFNREDEENNVKNAMACYKRLKEVETQKKK